MPDLLQPTVASNVPAKTVAGFWVISFRAWGKNLCESFPPYEFGGIERMIPFAQISDRRINAAIPQNRTGQALIGPFETRFSAGRIWSRAVTKGAILDA